MKNNSPEFVTRRQKTAAVTADDVLGLFRGQALKLCNIGIAPALVEAGLGAALVELLLQMRGESGAAARLLEMAAAVDGPPPAVQ